MIQYYAECHICKKHVLVPSAEGQMYIMQHQIPCKQCWLKLIKAHHHE